MAGKSNGKIGIFFDRDGTIIEDKGYLSDPDNVEFVPDSIAALKLLVKNGFKLFIATNQSGIARRLLNKEQLGLIHKRMTSILSLNGVRLDAIFFCPHHPNEKCSCRKPNIAMALQAKKGFNIDLDRSYSVGDKLSDVIFGKNFGGRGILVLTGIKDKGDVESIPDYTAKDLRDAVNWIIKDSQNTESQKEANAKINTVEREAVADNKHV